MKIPSLLALSVLLSAPLQAQMFEFYNATPNLSIPDGNATGVSDTLTVASGGIAISQLKVTLDLSGDFNGDLYVYLRHDSGFSVLLNRPGRESGSTFGYADSGFNVTLSDTAAHDIHTYRDLATPASGLQLSGEWQPDGRNTDPATVLTSSTRDAPLSSFLGIDPNGQWTIYAADRINGGTSVLQGWGLEMTVVPEPQETLLAIGAALSGFAVWRAARKRKAG